ncbi:hypothetical protein T492DRAFT_1120198 [Pavlovales sp. CCMP2436]|nr:hypothetical protein T492DRAFT_1120198 [Pavlovales sp. CCMP2436]
MTSALPRSDTSLAGDEGIDRLASIPEELRQLLVDEHLSLPSLGRLMQTSKALQGLCASSAAWQRGCDALGPLNCLHQIIQKGGTVALGAGAQIETWLWAKETEIELGKQVADWLKANDPRLQAGFERATPFERFRSLLAFLQAAARNVRRMHDVEGGSACAPSGYSCVAGTAHAVRQSTDMKESIPGIGHYIWGDHAPYSLDYKYIPGQDESWERESYEDHGRRPRYALLGSGAACRFKHLALGSDGHLRALVSGCRGLQGLDESLFGRALVESVCPMPTDQQLAASLSTGHARTAKRHSRLDVQLGDKPYV